MLRDLKVIHSELLDAPIVKEDVLLDIRIPSNLRKRLKDALSPQGYFLNNYTSYAITDKAKDEKPANYALIPNQYFSFACKMHDFAIELYKYFELFEKIRGEAKYFVGTYAEIASNVRLNADLLSLFEDDEELILFSKFLDKDDSSHRLGSKRLINDEGKPRGSKDCFSSVILKEINLPDSSSSIFGNIVYELAQSHELFRDLKEFYDENAQDVVLGVGEYNLQSLPKPFILLAGMSGTGKTRFVKEQARRFELNGKNYCLVPVRPDWHEPSDLLGYVSRISGKPQYISTKVLGFIINAWRVMAPDASADGTGELDFTVAPYWLCLDEMNLAPVEQYFADYLSVLESRKLRDGEYRCEALLDNSLLQDLCKDEGTIQKDLGLENDEGLWQYFLSNGIGIPPNLIVAGTVNMDETTHGFSRKVIDRAFSFDFGEFFPNDYSSFFEQQSRARSFSYPLITQTKKDDLTGCYDEGGEKTIAFLEAVNGILRRTPFELAYRALNELLLQVICFKPEDEAQLQAVWDDFLMSKVLPRIDGDEDKLRIKSENAAENVLQALSTLLEKQLDNIWSGTRMDFYREGIDGSSIDEIGCRTKDKLQWMQDRLEVNTFTSFWP